MAGDRINSDGWQKSPDQGVSGVMDFWHAKTEGGRDVMITHNYNPELRGGVQFEARAFDYGADGRKEDAQEIAFKLDGVQTIEEAKTRCAAIVESTKPEPHLLPEQQQERLREQEFNDLVAEMTRTGLYATFAIPGDATDGWINFEQVNPTRRAFLDAGRPVLEGELRAGRSRIEVLPLPDMTEAFASENSATRAAASRAWNKHKQDEANAAAAVAEICWGVTKRFAHLLADADERKYKRLGERGIRERIKTAHSKGRGLIEEAMSGGDFGPERRDRLVRESVEKAQRAVFNEADGLIESSVRGVVFFWRLNYLLRRMIGGWDFFEHSEARHGRRLSLMAGKIKGERLGKGAYTMNECLAAALVAIQRETTMKLRPNNKGRAVLRLKPEEDVRLQELINQLETANNGGTA